MEMLMKNQAPSPVLSFKLRDAAERSSMGLIDANTWNKHPESHSYKG
jgi:hypothetical protein